jgi:hypothetical protein
MDKIIKITTGLFIVIFVLFVSVMSYNTFIKHSFESSLESTYDYKCIISTDTTLTNVTLFIPLPVNNGGDSPIVEHFSMKDVKGVPSEWKTTLLGSNKRTMVKIQASIIKPVNNSINSKSYQFEFSINEKAGHIIDTQNPQDNDIVFRPLRDLKVIDCSNTSLGGICYNFQSSIYADYSTTPNATVSIDSYIVGKNEWEIFNPASNEYRTSISMLNFGENHGWIVTNGSLETNIGSKLPFLFFTSIGSEAS